MKILYLCPDLGIPILGWKGASIHVRSLVSALSHSGVTVVVAAPVLNKSPWEGQAHLDSPVIQFNPSPVTSSATIGLKTLNETIGVENSIPAEVRRILTNRDILKQLRRQFNTNAPDIFYERASLYSTIGVTLGKELNKPVIIELNAPLVLEQSAYRDASLTELAMQAERWTLSRADAVITVSAPLRDYVISLGVDAHKVYVFPNAVNPKLFSPGLPDPELVKRFGLDNGPVLGYVGGLRQWHGLEVLPDLLGRLKKHHEHVRLVIAGDGPLGEELRQNFGERGLASNVVFTGTLPHESMAGIIRCFNVALAPYRPLDHSFYFSPLKIFEYMACGIPVVAPAIGQISELITNQETGLLYPAGDLDALTTSCERVLADLGLAQRLGKSAADLVLKRYTWECNASRVIDLAQSLIKAKRSVG